MQRPGYVRRNPNDSNFKDRIMLNSRLAIELPSTSGFINLCIGGTTEPETETEGAMSWLSVYRNEVDDLITALQYWQKYGTFMAVEHTGTGTGA